MATSSTALSIFLLAALSGCQDQSFGTFNTAPGVTISAPADGAQVAPEAAVELLGLAVDDQDDPQQLAITWSSSLDGVLGEGSPDAAGEVFLAVSSLTAGTHAVTLQAVDTAGSSSSTSISLEVAFGSSTEGAPTVVLAGPGEGDSFLQADTVTFVGTVTDGEQAWDTLSASLLSDLDGELWVGNPASNGTVSVDISGLSAGDHLVSLIAEDADGNVAEDQVGIVVLEDGRPTATILSPSDGSSYWTTDTISFRGTVSDTETDTESLVATWSSSLSGTLGSGAPDSSGTTSLATALIEGTHILTLAALDSDGKEGTDSIEVVVIDPLNSDDDGDGWTENEGDCDDADSATHPDATEACDEVDNDCDGYVNESWWDSYEPDDSSASSHDLGEVDVDFGWSSSGITVSGLTLHESGDEDWFSWQADDEWYDNIGINASASAFPSSGSYVLELYLKDGGSYVLKDSDSGSGRLAVSFEGDLFETDEDDWAVRVYASTWGAGTCSTTYDLQIES